MKKILPSLLAFVLLFIASGAFAYTPPTDLVGNAIQASTVAVTNNLLVVAIRLLFLFLVLQFVIDGIAMLSSDATIEKVIGKVTMAVTWAGFCLYLLEPAESGSGTRIGEFMQGTVDYFLAQASIWAGTNGGSFDTWDIMSIGLVSYGKVTIAVAKATATNIGNTAAMTLVPGLAFVTALMVFFTSVVILVCCGYIALKVFLVKIQAALFIALAPLSVAMLGLKGLRDQGIAPFKMLLGLVYRIVILAMIVMTLQIVAESFTNIIDAESFGIMADIWTPIIGGMFGFVLLAFLTHHADNIASSLASGNVALGSGDMAGSVAAGVAAGMAGVAAGAAINQGAGQSMSMASWFKLAGLGGKTALPGTSEAVETGLMTPGVKVPAPSTNTASSDSTTAAPAQRATGQAAGGLSSSSTQADEHASATPSNSQKRSGQSEATSQPQRNFSDSTPPPPQNPPSERAAASAARREARAAEEFAKQARARGMPEDQIAAINSAHSARAEAIRELGTQAGALGEKMQQDNVHDMGIHIDGFHRD